MPDHAPEPKVTGFRKVYTVHQVTRHSPAWEETDLCPYDLPLCHSASVFDGKRRPKAKVWHL